MKCCTDDDLIAELLRLVADVRRETREATIRECVRVCDAAEKTLLKDEPPRSYETAWCAAVVTELRSRIEALLTPPSAPAEVVRPPSWEATCERVLEGLTHPGSARDRFVTLMEALARHAESMSDREILEDAALDGIDIRAEANRIRDVLAGAPPQSSPAKPKCKVCGYGPGSHGSAAYITVPPHAYEPEEPGHG
ncbi:MAG TPA: hypothetical protein VNU21_12520 [Usitatibacter sp.]|nr:hypothetical protein [Usitatibacter sp.]